MASQPVKVDWVPPNVAPDLVADYLEKLGTKNVPVAGSEAAAKRKQQLEFQVPPHDLDAGFCDNLSEAESQQLQQYVQKIRENCVGQGSVVRVGNYGHATVANIHKPLHLKEVVFDEDKYCEVMTALKEPPVSDPILCSLLSNEKLSKVIIEPVQCAYPKIFVAFSEPLSDGPLTQEVASKLSPSVKQKLNGLNEAAVESLVLNGPIYDKIFGLLNVSTYAIDIQSNTVDTRLLLDCQQFWIRNKLPLDIIGYLFFPTRKTIWIFHAILVWVR